MSACSKNGVKHACIVMILLWLSGCSHDPLKVPVKDLRERPVVIKGVHVVKSGESLYGISWLYNRDFKEIAAVNKLTFPYTIYPGQKLSLARKTRSDRVASISRKVVPSQNHLSKTDEKTSPNKVHKMGDDSEWLWPVSGEVIEGFSLSGRVNKGIDIKSKLGESVRAAAAGDIVYSGSDLEGYGRLIIIKHNSSYLSAYAHNRELFVREGDSVKAGQKIAEIGSTGTIEPKLHFEIRRNGKPVDPLGYLPRR
ncbi:peptidoglycan DD-metalloendopeptidase family protein [Candidatus Sororendozoicomonas aggregata]|uniref:peptidoglycan DD-metalloendopeptidase family protein n=1 Tax=Candidatus Sororendozoicomonas aggregata TaxID=3073239 RepID=UPI002ED0A666